MRLPYLTASIAMIFLLVGCTSSIEGQKDQTKEDSASIIGSWGTSKGDSIEIESKPWLLIRKDGIFEAYDGCYPVYGTWSESIDGVDLMPQGKTALPEGCKEIWAGKVDSLEIENNLITIKNLEGEDLINLSLVSRDTTLIAEEKSIQTMDKGAKIAECITGLSNEECPKNTSKTHKSKTFNDTEYTKRFG